MLFKSGINFMEVKKCEKTCHGKEVGHIESRTW